ncbi:hypothetical protein CBR_g41049 [Chara braunii]|uniref:Flotillin-like n=1 Tax=Chara braunii TaxID=69332 RepID=A0A388LV58_CHABU|nr:hypothetical protein CBR_g41049 [Chara braunii]|eukprot:GBG86145.1 hypothetical protein CBR_g41049 [Chara braunii]
MHGACPLAVLAKLKSSFGCSMRINILFDQEFLECGYWRSLQPFVQEADANLYAGQQAAESHLYARKTEAEGELIVAEKAAEGSFIESQKSAEAVEVQLKKQAEAVKARLATFNGDIKQALQYMTIEKGVYQELAETKAEAVARIAPEFRVWDGTLKKSPDCHTMETQGKSAGQQDVPSTDTATGKTPIPRPLSVQFLQNIAHLLRGNQPLPEKVAAGIAHGAVTGMAASVAGTAAGSNSSAGR